MHPPETARALFECLPLVEELARAAPDNLASLRGFFARKPHNVTAELLIRISADGPGVNENDLGRLSIPTLIIGHQQDHIHPIGYAKALATLIPGAIFAEITPKAQDPAAYRADFQAALARFLEGL